MTDLPESAPGDPHELLSAMRHLTRRVRRAQRATWFPLVVVGAITFAAIPVDRYGHRAMTCTTTHTPAGTGRVCYVFSPWSFAYWAIALVGAYALITGFYLRRSRTRGVGTPIRPYVLAGVGLAVVVTGVALWAAHHPMATGHDVLGLNMRPGSGAVMLLYRLAGPASAIGLALLVLSWVERNGPLLLFALGYLVIVLAPVTFGWTIAGPSPWVFLPHLIVPGGILLIGGIGFAVAQRAVRRPAA